MCIGIVGLLFTQHFHHTMNTLAQKPHFILYLSISIWVTHERGYLVKIFFFLVDFVNLCKVSDVIVLLGYILAKTDIQHVWKGFVLITL